MKKRYNFTLTDATAKKLQEASNKSGINMSKIVEKSIEEFLKKIEHNYTFQK